MEVNIFNILDIFEDIFSILGDTIEGIVEFLSDKFISMLEYLINRFLVFGYYLKCKLFYPHRVVIINPLVKTKESTEMWVVAKFGKNVSLNWFCISNKIAYDVYFHYNFKRKKDALHFKMVWKI